MRNFLATCFLLASSGFSSAAMIISADGQNYTFTFDPVQSAPLSPGFASYSSVPNGPSLNLLGWTPTNIIYGNLTVVSNTLIDATGAPVPDALVRGGMFNNTSSEVLGFGNTDGAGGFTVAGGSLTLQFPSAFGGIPHVLPTTESSTLRLGSYDPGTTGTNGNLNLFQPIPEPSSGLFLMSGIALAGFLRRRKTVA
ncbi:MAG: PEP-CTERM sorting domain-containing protein [Akkermansiaceae bacterium]